jgi:hypothetical protein
MWTARARGGSRPSKPDGNGTHGIAPDALLGIWALSCIRLTISKPVVQSLHVVKHAFRAPHPLVIIFHIACRFYRWFQHGSEYSENDGQS